MKLTVNESIERIFLVKAAEVKTAKSGSQYLDLHLVDKDNDVKGKLWDWSESKPSVEPMTLNRIIGKVNNFNGQLQVIVKDIQPVDESEVDMEDYVPCAPIDSDTILENIHSLLYEFENSDLILLCESAIDEVKEKLRYYPAAMSCHDAVRGGLLHHTYCMLQTAIRICAVYPSINSDLLYTGVILHDLAKIDEIDSAPVGIATGYTAKGNLIGHLVLGAMNVERLCNTYGIPDDVKLTVQHMLLSHHGIPEYGSPKVPMILEAQVLNLIDELDAKIYEFNEAAENTEPGTFSPKVFSLGNIQVYKPNI